MTEARNRGLFAVSVAALAAGIVWLTQATRSGCPPSTLVAGLALAFVPYVSALVSSSSVPDRPPWRMLPVVLTLCLGAPFLFAPPLLSDDVYRYLWEGRLWLEGFNPYRLPPSDPTLQHLRNDLWAAINNKPLSTIYPPLSQTLFAVGAWLGGGIWTFKLLALAGHAATVAVVGRLVDSPRAPLALALNPLLLAESALSGHLDLLCGLAILVAATSVAHARWGRAALATLAAIGLKVVGIVLLPLFRPRPRVLFAVVAGAFLALAPLVFWRGPQDVVSGAGQYASRWRGNESLFALADWALGWFVDPEHAGTAARIAVGLALTLLCARVARRRTAPIPAARLLIWAVLLLSPQVHPWYLGWLLPLEAAAGGAAGFVWSAVTLLAYAPLDLWHAEGVWRMPAWLQVLEYAVLGAALWADPRRPGFQDTRADHTISE